MARLGGYKPAREIHTRGLRLRAGRHPAGRSGVRNLPDFPRPRGGL